MPKNVLITGATSGIGEATAYAFAKEGENVILTGRRVERLEALKEELQATYPGPKSLDFCTGCYRYGHGQGRLPSHSQKCGSSPCLSQ
ncbi:Putative serine 3-dehydrogenase [Streptococcus thermophilus]|nr:Putative serine 3-dehydrogenase [Streptococcus thermophilus]CDA39742.1 putative serine 3-dehydrogenase [Streptococcus thermophilus CAG:236]